MVLTLTLVGNFQRARSDFAKITLAWGRCQNLVMVQADRPWEGKMNFPTYEVLSGMTFCTLKCFSKVFWQTLPKLGQRVGALLLMLREEKFGARANTR